MVHFRTMPTMINRQLSPKLSQLYQSYLVRLWQDDPQAPWRILAQSIQSGETRHFVDLDSFFAFLRARTASEEAAVVPAQAGADSETLGQ